MKSKTLTDTKHQKETDKKNHREHGHGKFFLKSVKRFETILT